MKRLLHVLPYTHPRAYCTMLFIQQLHAGWYMRPVRNILNNNDLIGWFVGFVGCFIWQMVDWLLVGWSVVVGWLVDIMMVGWFLGWLVYCWRCDRCTSKWMIVQAVVALRVYKAMPQSKRSMVAFPQEEHMCQQVKFWTCVLIFGIAFFSSPWEILPNSEEPLFFWRQRSYFFVCHKNTNNQDEKKIPFFAYYLD